MADQCQNRWCHAAVELGDLRRFRNLFGTTAAYLENRFLSLGTNCQIGYSHVRKFSISNYIMPFQFARFDVKVEAAVLSHQRVFFSTNPKLNQF